MKLKSKHPVWNIVGNVTREIFKGKESETEWTWCWTCLGRLWLWTLWSSWRNFEQFAISTRLISHNTIILFCLQLWEVYKERRCLRTYLGHAKAVRAIDWNYDGTKFLSCSYDRHIKLWDTETGECVCVQVMRECVWFVHDVCSMCDVSLSGLLSEVSLLPGKCLSRFTNSKTPYCVRFNPDADKSHLFVVGCADKKIYTVSVCLWRYQNLSTLMVERELWQQ